MNDAWKCVLLSETMVTVDGRPTGPAPAEWWRGGLDALLPRLAPRLAPRAVVLVTGRGAELLKLRAPDWSTFHGQGQPTVHLGQIHKMDRSVDRDGHPTKSPLLAGNSAVNTTGAFALWHELTGTPYRGTPGMAGMAVMGHYGRPAKPVWKSSATPAGAVEMPYYPEDFTGQRPTGRWVHGFDKIRAYVAAAMLTEVASEELTHTGKGTPWTPRTAGWWLVELSPWNEPRMPHPAGYVDGPARQIVRPLTAPTMALLHQLTERGIYGGVRVLDSWTAPAKDGVLRPWATTMRDAYARAAAVDTPAGHMVTRAIKMAGRETLGLLNHETNWAYRPDWWFSVVAMSRANGWRSAYEIGETTDRWPLKFDTDMMYFDSDERDPAKAAPVWAGAGGRIRGIQLDPAGIRLGYYRAKKRLENRADRVRKPRTNAPANV